MIFYSMTHETHSLTDSLTHLLTHSPTHSFSSDFVFVAILLNVIADEMNINYRTIAVLSFHLLFADWLIAVIIQSFKNGFDFLDIFIIYS